MSSPHILLNNPQKSKFIPSVRHPRGKISQMSHLKHILLNYDLFYLTNPNSSYMFCLLSVTANLNCFIAMVPTKSVAMVLINMEYLSG